ncbi:MAG: PIN domain-containing protein [Anaerolineae bacterium]|nr:PIN domain-containing protein [Anaerolineae bacterium]
MNRWVTDTHALLWYLYDAQKLSVDAKEVFTKADAGEAEIIIPAIALVEIVYLAEKGRIAVDAVKNVLQLLSSHADNYAIADLNLGVAMALQMVDRAFVPDMPDRIIAATALHLNLPLLSRDGQIASLPGITVVW